MSTASEIEKLPLRLKQEWNRYEIPETPEILTLEKMMDEQGSKVRQLKADKVADEVIKDDVNQLLLLKDKLTEKKWAIFKKNLGIEFKDSVLSIEGKAKEMMNANETVFSIWKNWKWRFCKKDKTWEEFKTEWDLENNTTMFEEISKLSDNMMNEWTMKYKNRYPHVYDIYQDDDEKSKSELWEEFKEIWELDFENYNEDVYNKMSEDLREQGQLTNFMRNTWYEWKTNANYHSYDSYSIIEQHEIWLRFMREHDLA